MSLDVYLLMKNAQTAEGHSGIYIRRDGQTIEISEQEWNSLYPGVPPVRVTSEECCEDVYSANITHNLCRMAKEAGINLTLWYPEEEFGKYSFDGVCRAKDLIDSLTRGLKALKEDPERFKEFNPANGWGSYDILVPWVERYLEACKKYPEAIVHVSR